MVSSRFHLLILTLLASASAATSVTVRCLSGASKKCIIAVLTASPSEEIELPNLTGKTSLQVKRGNMPAFSKSLADQLRTVTKLQLGSLELKELFLKPELEDVSAAGNLIERVEFEPEAEYRIMLLDLSENRIKSVEGFEVMKELRELNLKSNELESVDMNVFGAMDSLEKLNLGQNKIKSVTATEPVILPGLEFLSFSGNGLEKLEITSWDFGSLSELDLSSNELVHIDNLSNHFPSLQTIHLAKNAWHCAWLSQTLGNFTKNSVTIKDRDSNCEGITSHNICCIADAINSTHYENFHKIDALESKQKELQQTLNNELSKLKSDTKLSDLQQRLEKLEKSGGVRSETSSSNDSSTKTDFKVIKAQVHAMNGTLQEELKKWSAQKEDNDRAHRRLGFSIVDLKRSVERETKKIAELQAQFGLLKDHVRGKLDKRSRTEE